MITWLPSSLESAFSGSSWGPSTATIYFSLAAAAGALWIIYLRIKPLPVPSDLPGPRRYPFIGYLWFPLSKWDDWPAETLRQFRKYNGRTWGGPMPHFGGLPGCYFYICSENNVRQILQSRFTNYGKGDLWRRVLGELLGEGIFAVDGEPWQAHRKLMANMFSRNLLRHTAVVTVEKLRQAVKMWQDAITDNVAGGTASQEQEDDTKGIDVDLQDAFYRMTMDITSKIALGVDLDSLGQAQAPAFAQAFDELSTLCQKRFLDPLFEIKRFLRVSKRERRIRHLKQVVDDFCLDVIQQKRRSADQGSPLGPDLLSRFIDAGKSSNQELRDVVMNILLAGRDTTAVSLSWTFFELTRHPEVVTRIVQEVESTCGKGPNAEYSNDTMARLKYTHCVAMEVLRLHPPVTNDPRYALGNDTLPDGNMIPAGGGVDLCFYAMGRSTDIWGQDAEVFKPERFLEKKEPSPFMFPMFNGGPRACLGKPLALMNMKLALSILLTSDLKIVDKLGHSGDYQWSLVESMKGGFPVHISLDSSDRSG